jgi:hypothetical protein
VVPDAADVVGALDPEDPIPHLPQAIGLVQATQPRTDHHGVEVGLSRHVGSLPIG